MNQDWDLGVDVVIAGTGAAALSGALTASVAGLVPLVVEKADLWGGTTAYSGGGVWVPTNDWIQGEGRDTPQDALAYLEATVGEVGPASSPLRKRAYIEGAPAMARMFEAEGFRWAHGSHYPDYHFEHDSARTGRMLEGAPFDIGQLGPWSRTLRHRMAFSWIPLKCDEIASAVHATHSRAGLATAARLARRMALGGLTGRRYATMGMSLVAQLMYLVQKRAVPVWLQTPLRDLIIEDGRVVGAVVERAGRPLRVRTRHGVLLGVGGFSRNDDIRRRYHDFGAQWSIAIPEDQGDGLEIGAKCGADTDLMDVAWWVPMMFPPDAAPVTSLWDRGQPGAIIVDSTGQRFVNEAASYQDVALAILERHRSASAIPSWLIVDQQHRRRYALGMAPPGYTPKRWLSSGFVIKAATLSELAGRCGIDATGLEDQIFRFNRHAEVGSDPQFGRGETEYDHYYGDPRHQPNPNLAPLLTPPFYAVPIYPGDVGSKGGLLTDEHGRVIDRDGSPVPGLYAAGNTTASVMGLRYPGPGVSIGSATTFGYLAMRYAAEQSTRQVSAV